MDLNVIYPVFRTQFLGIVAMHSIEKHKIITLIARACVRACVRGEKGWQISFENVISPLIAM